MTPLDPGRAFLRVRPAPAGFRAEDLLPEADGFVSIREAVEAMRTSEKEVERLAMSGILRVRPTPDGPLVQPALVRLAGVRVRSR